jgi:poly(hydroxyalkanoate) depolymerase family esterase
LRNLRQTLPEVRFWQKLRRVMPTAYESNTRLREVFDFGSNPGNLRMFEFRPQSCGEQPPMVVVLHGCTQTAANYDLGAGWSTLAERYGFALLVPEQQRVNNPNGCFNWFLPDDSRRDQGEAFSIRQMIEKSVVAHGIDRRRIFVTGLSAGGAMTSVMLACYPDVFAGGAIIAGLPYGSATNVQQAFQSMYQSPSRSAIEWGDLVRRASSYRGPWPRISVWHGNADETVIPSNAREILKQWTDVHGLSISPSARTRGRLKLVMSSLRRTLSPIWHMELHWRLAKAKGLAVFQDPFCCPLGFLRLITSQSFSASQRLPIQP